VIDLAPPHRIRAALAALIALALVLAGAVTASPAVADSGPHISVSPSTDLDPEAAHTLTVTGTGFVGDGAAHGVYVLFGATSVWSGGGPLAGSGWIVQTWVEPSAITDGAFTTTLSVPAGSLATGVAYHVATSAAHALSATNRTMDTFAAVTVAEPAPESTETPSPEPTETAGPEPTETATPDPTESASPEPTETASATPVPAVTVSKTAELNPEGDTIVVRGSGFVPSPPATSGIRQPLSGVFTGAYIVVGAFPDQWRPSAGASSAARIQTVAARWGVHADSVAAIGGPARGAAVIAEDGTFEVTLDVSENEDFEGNWGVYTYAGGGAVYAPFETFTPISFEHPAIETSVVSADAEDGAAVAVVGSGFGDVTGAYAAIIEKGTESEVNAGGGYVAFGYWMTPGAIVDGAFEKTIVAPTAKLDATTQYEVIVWQGHTMPTAETIYARADIAFTNAHWNTLFPPVPAIDVFLADGVTPVGDTPVALGDTLIVRGTGFDPQANVGGRGAPIPNTLPQGTYVVFGHFAEQWQPSAGAASSLRKIGSQKWALAESVLNQVPSDYQNLVRSQWVDLADDGSFTAELSVTEPSALVNDGHYGVFTYAAGGVTNSAQELEVPITIAAPEPVPTIETSVVSVDAEDGATVSIIGSGFGDVTGAYAAIIEKGTESQVTGEGGYVEFGFWMTPGAIVDGAFEKTIVAPTAKLDATTQYEVIVWQGHTMPTAETIYARADIAFTDADWGILFPGGGTPTPTPTPTTPTPTPREPVAPVAGGSMSWAISPSFNSYVTGTIAKGSISVGNGATRSGGTFWFGQAEVSTFSPATGTGTVSYGGSVRYFGHQGALDVTIANPQVRITSPSSASLYVTSGGRQVQFATLGLGAAQRSDVNGAVTFTNAPATLTAAGISQVLGGFSTTLAPVTFTIGVPAAAPLGATGTVAAASATTTTTTNGIPSAPPATSGIDLDEQSLAALQSGGVFTIEAAGFEPNETDIALVVYSTPTVIATDLTADAQGVVRWTGSLPASLADGEHTLTLQGSVDRGVVFTLTRAAAIGTCAVDGATLSWGFKESFRVYIEGIAAGGWELTDVEYVYPDYVWADGTGSIDPETMTGLVTYGGSIRFTGHDGALDTTLSNARLELAGETGYLVFDVAGQTQGGASVAEPGVRFAEFTVPSLGVVDGAITLDAVPATLTDAGAAAFGTYPRGEELDPISAIIPVTADCLTGAPAAADEPVAAVEGAAEDVASTSDPAPVWPWIAGGVGLLAVIVVAGVLIGRRRGAASGTGVDDN
jgi:hypothetical protein